LYIAHIDLTNNSLFGEWLIMIQSQGPYNIQVLGSSEVSFYERFYSIDASNVYRFSKIEGKPLQG